MRTDRVPKLLLTSVLGVALMPAWLAAQTLAAPSYPAYGTAKEIAITATGAGFFVASKVVHFDPGLVPPQGFDPADIQWSVDRDVIGNVDVDADVASDWTRVACILMPAVVTLTLGPDEQRWRELGRRLPIYAESFLCSQGLTNFWKRSSSRARPYAYIPEADRPDNAAYDASTNRTYYSMPSGHASSSWTGVALALTEHLLSRPEASWKERALLGFAGGGLGGATAALRVVAGQHFVSDVLTGSAIGIAAGVSVPLLHHGSTPLPSSKAWLATASGTVAGIVVGALVVQ